MSSIRQRQQSFNSSTILLAGATGPTGQLIAKKLAASGANVKCIVRNVEHAHKLLPKELKLVQGDTTVLSSLEAHLRDVSIIICCTGSRQPTSPEYMFSLNDNGASYHVDYQGVCNLIQIAKKYNDNHQQQQQIQHFVLVSTACILRATHPVSIMLNLLMQMVMKWKLEGERALRQSGLTYTVVRPGGLTNQIQSHGVAFGQGDTLNGRISRDDVAEIVLQCLTQPNAKNTTFECVWSDEKSLPSATIEPPSSESTFTAVSSSSSSSSSAAASTTATGLLNPPSVSRNWDPLFASLQEDKGDLPHVPHTTVARTVTALLVGSFLLFCWWLY